MSENQSPVFLLVPAGGSGLRFGGPVKKQFLSLDGESLLNLTLKKFLPLPEIKKIVVALPEEDLPQQSQSFPHEKIKYLSGGTCRAESVKKAFLALGQQKPDAVILVHDAVRPLLSADLIRRVIGTVQDRATAIPVLPLSDTIKMVEEGTVRRTVRREHLFAAQTPQGARFELFEHAYNFGPKDLSQVTDEAMLLESIACPVNVVEGERTNIKITTKMDLAVAEKFLEFLTNT